MAKTAKKQVSRVSKFSLKAETFISPYGKERAKYSLFDASGSPLNLPSIDAFKAFCAYVNSLGHKVSTWHGVISITGNPAELTAEIVTGICEQFERNGYEFSQRVAKPKKAEQPKSKQADELQALRADMQKQQELINQLLQTFGQAYKK